MLLLVAAVTVAAVLTAAARPSLAVIASVTRNLVPVALVMVALLAASFAFWRDPLQLFRRLRALSDLLRDYAIPECLVIAPEGLVLHLIVPWANRLTRHRPRDPLLPATSPDGILHGGVAFAQVRSIERRARWTGMPALRIELRDGSAIAVPLTSFVTNAEMICGQVIAAFAAYRSHMTDATAAST